MATTNTTQIIPKILNSLFDSYEAKNIGFGLSHFFRVSFPYVKTTDHQITKPTSAGRLQIFTNPSATLKNGTILETFELPYGKYARVLQFFIDTEIVKQSSFSPATRNRLFFGDSLNAFLGRLGLERGGVTGKELLRQMRNICAVSLAFSSADTKGSFGFRGNIVSAWFFPFEKKHHDQLVLENAYIDISPTYAEYVRKYCAPFDEDFLAFLVKNGSAADIDLAFFLCYRNHGIAVGGEVRMTVEQLSSHLGFSMDMSKKTSRQYVKTAVKKGLTKIKSYWPVLDADFDVSGDFVLRKSKPLIKPQPKREVIDV